MRACTIASDVFGSSGFICFCLFLPNELEEKKPATLLGLLLPIVSFGLVDAITLSYPFQSFFGLFQVVIIEGRVENQGIGYNFAPDPWYWYLLQVSNSFPSTVFISPVGVRRSHFLGWLAVIIVGTLSALPHKEYRYMYPVMPIVITLAALGFVEFVEDFNKWGKTPLSPKAITVAGLIFCILTSALFAWRSPGWTHSSGGLIAMDRLSQDPSVCGVGLYKLSWIYSGGYSHLHRNVPIVLVLRDAELEEQAPVSTLSSRMEVLRSEHGLYLFRMLEWRLSLQKAGFLRRFRENQRDKQNTPGNREIRPACQAVHIT